MTLRLVEAGKRFLQSRVIKESEDSYKSRVRGEREEIRAGLNAANEVVEKEIAEHGLSKDVFEWSRERTYQADADFH